MRLSVKKRFTHKNWAGKKTTMHWRLQFYFLKVNSGDPTFIKVGVLGRNEPVIVFAALEH